MICIMKGTFFFFTTTGLNPITQQLTVYLYMNTVLLYAHAIIYTAHVSPLTVSLSQETLMLLKPLQQAELETFSL